MTYVGTMLSATPGIWADNATERALAHAVFGTPLDRRTMFTEPHGFWWGVLEIFCPHANPLHVWMVEGGKGD